MSHNSRSGYGKIYCPIAAGDDSSSGDCAAALLNLTTAVWFQNGPQTGPWRGLFCGWGWKLGHTGRAFFLVAWRCILGAQHCFQGGQSRLWHGEGPAKPGFKDCWVVRALRVLNSVVCGRAGARRAEGGFRAPPPRAPSAKLQFHTRGLLTPASSRVKRTLQLMASRERGGECGKEEGRGTRRWLHAVRVSGS